jgi:hypothetical protein
VSRTSVHLERAGIPTVSIVGTGFTGMFDLLAGGLGVDGLPYGEYPGLVATDPDDVLRAKVADTLVPRLLTALGGTPSAAVVRTDEPGQADIVYRGDLDAVQEYFTERHWTDGLPIVPPTLDRVRRFLDHTTRDPAEVLGVLPPEQRAATVWSVAVNAVLAGCRPEYLPVLIAAVEAVCDPLFRAEDAGSTPSWEPIVIVSGPGVRALKFNTGPGLLKVGHQANTSVGRFLRLFLRNVAGLRPETGTDKGTIGFTFNVALAEDDEALAGLGWAPSRIEQGFAPEDTVVTVQSVLGSAGPLYSSGATVAEHLAALVQVAATTTGGWSGIGVAKNHWHPLLVLNPSIAKLLVAEGWTKDDLRRHLYDHTKVPAHWMNRSLADGGLTGTTLEGLVHDGRAAPRFAESADQDRMVPVFLRPEWIGIVVSGDADRNQSRFLINNHNQGVPVSRRVDWSST